MMPVTSDMPGLLDTLPAISLRDALEQASFLTRRDRKYLVPVTALVPVLAELDRQALVLEIDDRRCFGYTTPYFDGDDHAAYLGALRRRPQRFKVRTRLYVDSGLRQLEVKIRDGRGRTVKHRIDHEGVALDRLTDRDRQWLRTFPQVAEHVDGLRHRVTTFYRRSTLVLPDGAGRVTIDRDLMFALPDGQALALPGTAVIETKGAGKPTTFDRILWRGGYRPQSMSKFAIGLSLLLPQLPANRWHRLRNRLLAMAEGTTAVPPGINL